MQCVCVGADADAMVEAQSRFCQDFKLISGMMLIQKGSVVADAYSWLGPVNVKSVHSN